MNITTHTKILLAFGFLTLMVIFLTPTVSWSAFGLEETGVTSGDNALPTMSGSSDVKLLIGTIIKYLLGFLGIVFLILIIYGGFIWMMARGDEKEIKKAQDLIKAAVIGVVVMLCAYIIADFVLTDVSNNLLRSGATAGGEPASGDEEPDLPEA